MIRILSRLNQFVDWCKLHNLQLEQLKAIHLRKYIHHNTERPHYRTGKPLSSSDIRLITLSKDTDIRKAETLTSVGVKGVE